MSNIIKFSPSPSLFGFGALVELSGLLKSRGFRRIFLVTDPQVGASNILDRVLHLLKGSFDVELFTDAPSEPHSSAVDKVGERFESKFDAFLGVGGGSAMDFAKALSIVSTHGGLLESYVGEGTVPGPVIPIVYIPTTSGTGSQNTQTTVFTTRGVKLGCSSEYIRPVASIVDPELTMELPPMVTRNSGYDALMHAVESFIARPNTQVPERPILYQGSNPFSRSLAREAFCCIWSSFREAVSHGNSREARIGMSIGSHLASIGFSHSGLGLVHALASSLGGMINAPHGVCLAACTTMGLTYNFRACERDLGMLGSMMVTKDEVGSRPVSAKGFFRKIQELIRDLDLPLRPSELGIKKEDAQELLDKTLIQTRRLKTNPRPIDDGLLACIENGI